MAITKLSNSSIKTLNKSDSLLVGNPAYYPPILVEYLVVGGGGASNRFGAGGGGAVKTSSSYALTINSSYTVTVAATTNSGTQAPSSVLGTITATGGACGHTTYGNGLNGSSGSGAVTSSTTLYTGGTGLDGGNGGNCQYSGATYPYSGGGGGAGGSASFMNGGAGISNSITGTTTYYGATRGNHGASNTGSGGGADSWMGTQTTQGGSGFVCIAYPNSYPALTSISGGLTYTVDTTTRSGYRIYKFTAGTGTVTI